MTEDPTPKVDPESFLESFREGSELIGFGAPSPEFELQLVDAIGKANEWVAQPYRALPCRRSAVVAFLRGVVSALSEEGLQDLYRYHSDPNEPTVRKWWERGYYWTHAVTRNRFNIYTCTACHRRVHNPNTYEHDPACKAHPNNYVDPFDRFRANHA